MGAVEKPVIRSKLSSHELEQRILRLPGAAALVRHMISEGDIAKVKASAGTKVLYSEHWLTASTTLRCITAEHAALIGNAYARGALANGLLIRREA